MHMVLDILINFIQEQWAASTKSFLVLVWLLLIMVAGVTLVRSFKKMLHLDLSDYFTIPQYLLDTILVSVAVLVAPLTGWLADAKFGNYKVFRVGIILIFLSTVTNCLMLLLEELVWENKLTLRLTLICLTVGMFGIGGCACVVTVLPLGLN